MVATAWGEGSTWMFDHLRGLLGGEDSTDGFVPRHPAVAASWRSIVKWPPMHTSATSIGSRSFTSFRSENRQVSPRW